MRFQNESYNWSYNWKHFFDPFFEIKPHKTTILYIEHSKNSHYKNKPR